MLNDPKMKNLSLRSQKRQSLNSQIFSIGQRLILGLKSPEAITGSKFRIESYLLLASSQHVGTTAVVPLVQLEIMLLERKKINPKIRWLEISQIFGLMRLIFFIILSPMNIGTYGNS